ncbi:UNVERIFIED_CONTAM: hypothetical protein FKN15_017381 [Acipenser sinensis]
MENQTLTSLNFSEIGDRPHVTIREPITERTTRLSDLYITQEGADLSGGDDDEGNLTDSVAIGQLIEHCSHLTDRVEQLETELSEFQESSINREQVLRGYIEGRFADMENRRQEALDEMDLEVVKCLKRRDVLWGEELKKLFKKTSTPRLPLSLPSLSSRKRSAPQQLSFDGGSAVYHRSRTEGSLSQAKLPIKINFPEFGGEASSDAIDFLDKCDEFLALRPMTPSEILATMSSVLKGSAKSWWFAERKGIQSWEQFKTAFRQAFLPSDFQTEVEDRLRSRVQLPETSIYRHKKSTNLSVAGSCKETGRRKTASNAKKNTV